jgi:integrase/recombinase XerD
VDFDFRQLKVVQGKCKKDFYVMPSKQLILGPLTYIDAKKLKTYLFNRQSVRRAEGETST